MPKSSLFVSLTVVALLAMPVMAAAKKTKPADMVFSGGPIYTAEEGPKPEAVAIRDGYIVYVGDQAGLKPFIGKKTQQIDLKAKMLMPGLVDGHMHPQSGGLRMRMCNLNYESLTLKAMTAKIQACLDKDKSAGPNDWLEVINWFEQDMEPKGTVLTFADLDGLKTSRPVLVRSSFGHTTQLNRKAVEVVDLDHQATPPGGIIVKDGAGHATGRLEDAAQGIARDRVPAPSEAANYDAAQMAVKAMNAQGLTTILDVYSDLETLGAYKTLLKQGKLSVRAHFGWLIDLDVQPDVAKSVAEVVKRRTDYDQGPLKPKPSMSVTGAKIFLDGVITAPSFTGTMVDPYFVDRGEKADPRFGPSLNRGPKPYISRAQLADVMIRLSDEGLETHMHADGDGAVKLALDATEDMKKARPKADRRPAIAHAEIVDPADFARFGPLNALPVLSFQWGKPAADTVEGARDFLGPYRAAILEPQGLLDIYGAKIVFGSDWPVDPLNEWFALEVAITRMANEPDRAKYPGRLGVDPGLSLDHALKAMTINAAYSLHAENVVGSIKVGKFADLIVINQDLFAIKPDAVSDTKVIMTLVGGKAVHLGN